MANKPQFGGIFRRKWKKPDVTVERPPISPEEPLRTSGHSFTRWKSVLGAVYGAILVGRSLTSAPYVDESWYALPAWNLAVNGSMGIPVLEDSASPMPGMSVSLKGIRAHRDSEPAVYNYISGVLRTDCQEKFRAGSR